VKNLDHGQFFYHKLELPVLQSRPAGFVFSAHLLMMSGCMHLICSVDLPLQAKPNNLDWSTVLAFVFRISGAAFLD
jgi:hypothetical protein